jgi:hypothetical protein
MAKTSVKTAQAAPKSYSREPQISAMTLRVTQAAIRNKNAPGEYAKGIERLEQKPIFYKGGFRSTDPIFPSR